MAKKTKSPWVLFREWLSNPLPNATLSPDVIAAINPRSALLMFGKVGGITIYLNNYFNTFNLMNLPPIEFYKLLRIIALKFKFKAQDYVYFKHEKQDTNLIRLHRYFPYLKRHEIAILLELAKDDDDFEALQEALGLIKTKKRKVKKDEKELTKREVITMKDWRKNFKRK